ncbi:glycine--tRNA ligase subunit beta [Pseudogracilibacillus sp. SE30717A]|uniref:glycine--tRNA ligase subunit beta n=1 Tax=Pseudogracilibacillus sp. SE30717A TaxID=3098293 RepID=UPI00300E2955
MSKHVLFEIGLEELPARFIDQAEKQLYNLTKKWLEENHIQFEKIKTYSTPRRLAVQIHSIADYQTTITEEVRGPQEKIAKDENGEWSKAAIGFTKGQGKNPEDIYMKEVKNTRYIFIEKRIDGKKTEDILPGFADIISSIHFPQTMRWGSDTYRFARPIRWLVALYDNKVIPFEVAHVKTDNVTYGHRFLGDKCILTDPLMYETMLEKNYVIADPFKREKIIVEQIDELAKETGYYISVEKDLLEEVRNLVEYPTAFYGQFEEEYLNLPSETLITSMAEHQRYFPVLTEENGSLLSYFVGVRNGDDKEITNVIRGNEKVLRARLADAAFFYDEDQKHSIDFYLEKLKTVVFQDKIGTIYEKSQNISLITQKICNQLGLDERLTNLAVRAAEICKFDLVTDMVNEFPELQGIMGEKYALHFGEKEEVAKAIKEHYLPVQSNGSLPSTEVGAIVAIADKLDTIIGCISVGLVPTGSQDPYGLRRQAIGILRILLDQKWDLSVESLLNITEDLYDITDEKIKEDIHHFIKNRATYILTEREIEQDVVKSVVTNQVGIFYYTAEKAKLLSQKRNDDSFRPVQEALVRVMNLGKKHQENVIEESLFQTDSEQQLYNTFLSIRDSFSKAETKADAEEALSQLSKLAEPIHTFFEHNMVMAEDERIKRNRLSLVYHLSNLIEQYADMTQIEWKQHQ